VGYQPDDRLCRHEEVARDSRLTRTLLRSHSPAWIGHPMSMTATYFCALRLIARR
jgi:hypothetical protein